MQGNVVVVQDEWCASGVLNLKLKDSDLLLLCDIIIMPVIILRLVQCVWLALAALTNLESESLWAAASWGPPC